MTELVNFIFDIINYYIIIIIITIIIIIINFFKVLQNIKQFETIMYDFIWDSKPAKVKTDILTMDYERGGVKMIDLETFIKL